MTACKKVQPELVILENVRNLLYRTKNSSGGFALPPVNRVVRDFRDNGYVATFNLLNSEDYAMPQRRHRAWGVAIRCKAGDIR